MGTVKKRTVMDNKIYYKHAWENGILSRDNNPGLTLRPNKYFESKAAPSSFAVSDGGCQEEKILFNTQQDVLKIRLPILQSYMFLTMVLSHNFTL